MNAFAVARGGREIALLILWGLVTAASGAKVRDFPWQLPLEDIRPPGALYRAAITPETWDGSDQESLQDLRIFDADGRRWPFFFWTERDQPAEETLPATRLNEMDHPGPRQFDIHLDAPATAGHDRLRLEFPDREYMRRVEIFGRERETDDWGRLGGGFVVRIPRQPPVREDRVGYALSTFRHLRVVIHPDQRRPAETVPPVTARIVRTVARPAPRIRTELTAVPASSGDARWQTVSFDAGLALPLEVLELRADGAYARDVRLYRRATETDSWQFTGQGRIVRHAEAGFDRVPAGGQRSRYWKAEIARGDDQPLTGLSATGLSRQRWIVFEAVSDRPAAVYAGAPDLPPADHDLERRTPEPSLAAIARLDARAANPAYRPGPDLPRWLIPLGIALASLLVLGVIIRLARDLTAKELTED